MIKRIFRIGGSDAQTVAVAMLALTCLIGLVRVLATIGLAVPFDPNEGWNAYHTAAAMSGGPLYPDADSFMVNNYPPLSFYIVGSLGIVIGDNILAGRIVSFAALLSVAFGIAAIVRVMGANRLQALFSALLFVSCLLVFTDYVGMDDPQMLGHAIAILGVLLLLNEPRTTRSVALGALLLTLAGFVKHNLIVQPVVMVIWLSIYDRRSAARLVCFGAVFALVGLVIFQFAYGVDLLGELNSPRRYSLSLFAAGVKNWLPWGFLPLVGVAVLSFVHHDDRYVILTALYGFAAFVWGAALIGGAGVDANAFFDADIALAIGGGLLLARCGGDRRIVVSSAIILSYMVPLAYGVWRAADGDGPDIRPWTRLMTEEAVIARNDIGFLRIQHGPVLCDMLSLCFWADKEPEVDTFNIHEQYETTARSDSTLVRLIDAKYFRAMQFDSSPADALTPRVGDAVYRAYRIDHTDDYGVFLVPR